MKVVCTCAYCGKRFERWPHEVKGRTWCSQSCHMKTMNAELNPTRWQTEKRDREKWRLKRLGPDSCESYRKLYGKHEHRVVAERMNGGPLPEGAVVHHINGNRRDNRPENLKIFASHAEHMREGHPGRDQGRWSK